jgi:plastocyanin
LTDAAHSAGIQIDNFHYSSPTLVVASGTTVTWKNDDDSPHSVREKDGKFKSAALDTGDTFSQPSPRRANINISARSTPI